MTRYEPGTPSWVDVGTPDVDASVAFYSALFGWEVDEAGPVEESGGYRMARLRGKAVAGFGPQQNPGPPVWTTYVTVADVDRTMALVREKGGTVLLEPMDVLTAGRMAVFMDPTGAACSVWQAKEHIGAELVNEPGTLAWNELNTRALEESKAFYGAVFGWDAHTHEAAGPMGSYTEWKLDGRSVGGMLPMPPMVPAQVPNHWLVYFAVDDCDASVARVEELGGSVIMPAMDIEPGRFSVVAGPHGDVFCVMKLKAELAGG